MAGTDAPLVSIGVLSYNRPADLAHALDSVLAQTYTRLEIIVSDNGSTNTQTRAVIARYAARDNRIKPFYHTENRGPQFNFRFLTEQATGIYFAWLADDDLLSPTQIEDCVGAFAAHPEAAMTAAMPLLNTPDSPFLPFSCPPHTVGLSPVEKYRKVINHLEADLNIFYYGLMRLDALKECSFYLKKVFRSDTLLLAELLNHGDLYLIDRRPGYVYTIHAEQTSVSLLPYRKITLRGETAFWERHAFFTLHFWYMRHIIGGSSLLSKSEKKVLLREFTSGWLRSKRHHLLKYDLGIHPVISFLRRYRVKR